MPLLAVPPPKAPMITAARAHRPFILSSSVIRARSRISARRYFNAAYPFQENLRSWVTWALSDDVGITQRADIPPYYQTSTWRRLAGFISAQVIHIHGDTLLKSGEIIAHRSRGFIRRCEFNNTLCACGILTWDLHAASRFNVVPSSVTRKKLYTLSRQPLAEVDETSARDTYSLTL